MDWHEEEREMRGSKVGCSGSELYSIVKKQIWLLSEIRGEAEVEGRESEIVLIEIFDGRS